MEDLCGNLDHDRASDRGSLCEVPGKMDSGDRILVGRLDGGHIFGLSFPVHVLLMDQSYVSESEHAYAHICDRLTAGP
jgi:hypothetical protein